MPNSKNIYSPLGQTPYDWNLVSLGELESRGVLWVKNGYAQGGYNQAGVGVAHLRPFNVSPQGVIDLSQIKYVDPPPNDSLYWVKRKDIIFNNTNSEELVGKTAYFDLDGKYVISNHMTIMRVLDEESLDSYWFAHVLYYSWLRGIFQAICRRHVNQASVSLARIRGINIPLPPLPEQRAIAYVLSTVRQSIEATERVIAAARELKRSLMKYLFTYGPVPIDQADQVVLKETEIGLVPEGWEVVELGQVIQMRKEIVQPEDYPELRYVGLEHLDSGEAQVKRYGFASDVKSSKHRFYPSDILYGKLRPYLDKCAIAKWEGISSTDILILIPKDGKTIPDYLVRLLHTSAYLNYATSTTSGTNLPRTSWASMQQYKFGMPNLDEQRFIGSVIGALDKKIISEDKRKVALEALFNSLLHHLMTGKVRVKPTPTPP